MATNPAQVEREILEGLKQLLDQGNGVETGQGRFVNVELLRARTQFSQSPSLKKEFFHRLQILEKNDFVKLVVLPEGDSFADAVITLSARGRERLLYSDEQFMRQHPVGPTVSNNFYGDVHQFAQTFGPESPIHQHSATMSRGPWNREDTAVDRLSVGQAAAPELKPSRLQLGNTMFAPIGNTGGHEALLIALSNSEKRYQYRCHDVRATLSFTHEHSRETVKKKGWFCSIDERTGRVCDLPANTITLDSKTQSRTWLIVYLNRNVEPMGQYWYMGPEPELSPLMADSLLSHENHRLLFGTWNVKIVIASAGDEGAERTMALQAE